MAITLKANVRWGGVDYAPGATIPGLTPSDEAGLVSSNRAEWVGTPSTTITAAVPVMATTGPGGGNRIQGRYDPLDIRPRYPAGYTKAPCRTPAVPIGTTAIDSPSVPGAAGTLDIDTDVKFNGKPTTRLTITGTRPIAEV